MSTVGALSKPLVLPSSRPPLLSPRLLPRWPHLLRSLCLRPGGWQGLRLLSKGFAVETWPTPEMAGVPLPLSRARLPQPLPRLLAAEEGKLNCR